MLKKPPSYLVNVFSNKVNKPLRYHSLVNGRDSWGNVRGKTLIARISCHLHIFINITHLTNIPMWKLCTLSLNEKSKAEKSPWEKKMKKTGPKRKKAPFCQAKKKKPC